MLQIVEVEDRKQLKEFVNFQYNLYKGNKYYVPSLRRNVFNTFNREKNPAFEFCDVRMWLAKKNGKIVGRVAGIVNRNYNKEVNEKYIRFGWLDFIDDKEIVSSLIKKVEDWGKELKLEKIHGPIGMTNFDPCGLLVDGFEETATASSIYNFPYYGEYIEELGFVKENDWIEFNIPVPEKTPPQLARIADIVKRKYDLTVVRPEKSEDLLKYGRRIFQLMNQAYKGLYVVLEFNDKQIEYYVKKYLPSLPPKYVSIVLQGDEVVAFGVSMPSISKALQKSNGKLFPFGFIRILKALKKNNVMDLMLIAVKPELQNKGINSIMFDELIPRYIESGIDYVETNSEMENNMKVQSQWKFFDPTLTKRKRSYVREIK
jgi:ribosomal protein S18 acetylase RimI-like enzyme